jgi:hypothetical protein
MKRGVKERRKWEKRNRGKSQEGIERGRREREEREEMTRAFGTNH